MKFFVKKPMAGKPLCLRGLADGLVAMEKALAGIRYEGGYVKWSNGIPIIVPATMEPIIEPEPVDPSEPYDPYDPYDPWDPPSAPGYPTVPGSGGHGGGSGPGSWPGGAPSPNIPSPPCGHPANDDGWSDHPDDPDPKHPGDDPSPPSSGHDDC